MVGDAVRPLNIGVSAMPTPERLTVCGLLEALSPTLSVAVSGFPATVGAKVTPRMQVAPGASGAEQSLFCTKLDTAPKERGVICALPTFDTATFCALLVWNTVTLGVKVRALTLTFTSRIRLSDSSAM